MVVSGLYNKVEKIRIVGKSNMVSADSSSRRRGSDNISIGHQY